MKKPARRTLNIILNSDYSDFVDYLNFDHGYQPDDYRGNGDVLVVTKVSKLMLPGLKISHDIFDIFLFQML